MADDAFVGRQIGGFEIVGVIGRGAFATVFRARQLRLGRDVALKILDPTLARDSRAAARFEREGWAAAGLDHPSIVPVYEAGEDDGVYYLAMRLVPGTSLADEIERASTFPIDRTAPVVRSVGEALDHAHARGVLHRDVKPGNILLEDDRVWLTDFGIAATAHDLSTYTTGAVGTALYMAPEQSTAGGADERSDLYGLGCVAFECVTGRPPFSGAAVAELLYAHRHEPVPSCGNDRLDAVWARALAKDPDERFQSGVELADALDDALGTARQATPVPVGAPRPRPSRQHTRRRLIAGAAVVVVLLAVLAAIVVARRDSSSPTVSSSSNSSSQRDSTARSQAAVAYTGAVAPVNAAQFAFAERANTWTDATPAAQAVSDAQDFLHAVQTVQTALGAIATQYPPAATDLQHDVVAAAAVQRDLLSLQDLNAGLTVADWRARYETDRTALIDASNAVRADLGLPTATN